MPAKKTISKKAVSLKETILKEITPLLSEAAAMLKKELGEKKFDKRIKKAAKFLVHGIKPVAPKKKPIKKKLLKKAAKKTAIPVKPVKK
jgi:DNA topoisomerase VI subunit B